MVNTNERTCLRTAMWQQLAGESNNLIHHIP